MATICASMRFPPLCCGSSAVAMIRPMAPAPSSPIFSIAARLRQGQHSVDGAPGFGGDSFRNAHFGSHRFERLDHAIKRDGLHERADRMRINGMERFLGKFLMELMQDSQLRS